MSQIRSPVSMKLAASRSLLHGTVCGRTLGERRFDGVDVRARTRGSDRAVAGPRCWTMSRYWRCSAQHVELAHEPRAAVQLAAHRRDARRVGRQQDIVVTPGAPSTKRTTSTLTSG